MKSKMILTLLLCALLSSCSQPSSPTNDPSNDTDIEETTTVPSLQDTTDDKTKITYYEHLVNELQEELLNLKTEIYVSRIEYESMIAQLEEQIKKEPLSPSPESNQNQASAFTYVIKNGTALITSYAGTEKHVSIPEAIDGYRVSAINNRAFANHTELESVTIPNGVQSIGWFAFSGCVALTEVSIPSSVSTIGYGAFENCNASLTVKCPADSYARQYANSYGFKTN
jgi:hypothetical protein